MDDARSIKDVLPELSTLPVERRRFLELGLLALCGRLMAAPVCSPTAMLADCNAANPNSCVGGVANICKSHNVCSEGSNQCDGSENICLAGNVCKTGNDCVAGATNECKHGNSCTGDGYSNTCSLANANSCYGGGEEGNSCDAKKMSNSCNGGANTCEGSWNTCAGPVANTCILGARNGCGPNSANTCSGDHANTCTAGGQNSSLGLENKVGA